MILFDPASNRKRLTFSEILIAVIGIVLPSLSSWPMVWRVVGLSVAWLAVLHLSFREIPALERLPRDVKIGRATIGTVCALIVLMMPINHAWRSEKSAETDGDLVPQGEPQAVLLGVHMAALADPGLARGRADHRKHAEECVAMARQSEARSDKALWLTLAQSWVRLPEHVARVTEIDSTEPAEAGETH